MQVDANRRRPGVSLAQRNLLLKQDELSAYVARKSLFRFSKNGTKWNKPIIYNYL